MRIRYPEGTEASGEVLEIHEPERIVFSYGYTSGKPIPAGGSRVTIELRKHVAGTELHLWHEFAEAAVRDQHVQGWRYQVAVFANVVADEIHAGLFHTNSRIRAFAANATRVFPDQISGSILMTHNVGPLGER